MAGSEPAVEARFASMILSALLIASLAAVREPLAASELIPEQVDAACREELARAESLPRETPEASSAWLTYLDCASHAIAVKLDFEEDRLRGDLVNTPVPADCSGVDAVTRRRYSEVVAALELANQLSEFRIEAPRIIRRHIEAAGLAARSGFAIGLRDLDRSAAARPRGLTPEYVEGLAGRFRSLSALLEECPTSPQWTVSCTAAVALGDTPMGRFRPCDHEEQLSRGMSIKTSAGSATAVFSEQDKEVVSVAMQSDSEVVVGRVDREGDEIEAELSILGGGIRILTNDATALTVGAGTAREGGSVYWCRMQPGDASLAFAQDGLRLSVEVFRGGVTVFNGAGSWTVHEGEREDFSAGRKVE